MSVVAMEKKANVILPIHYINKTGNTNFEVVVFVENINPDNAKVYYAAWQILRAQSQAIFYYPAKMSVGATYKSDHQTVIAGPFPSKPGSTWEITQDSIDDTAILKEVESNCDETIVVKNVKPNTWAGRQFDIGIYKSDKLLVIQKDVHVNGQVNFKLEPNLYFGITRKIHFGDIFESKEQFWGYNSFNLLDYPTGIVVTLTEESQGGQYSFTAEPMDPMTHCVHMSRVI